MSQQNSKKKTAAVIGIGFVVWALLIGGAIALALRNKPEPIVVRVDEVADAYKYSDDKIAKANDTVDDLDYYGTYKPNQITFSENTFGLVKGILQISGLKDAAVEEKINDRIKAVASELRKLNSERVADFSVKANYFNVLSIVARQYHNVNGIDELVERYLTFDLNTGDELSFDDLFPEGINYVPLFYNSFYTSLVSSIKFSAKHDRDLLKVVQSCKDPSGCWVMGSRITQSAEEIQARLASYDEQLANIENVIYNTIQAYLAGDKAFYLNSYGPALKIANDRTVEIELKDNIRYAVYLKKYRSKESLYKNDSINDSDPFFTEIPTMYSNFYNVEADNYFIDTQLNGNLSEMGLPAQQVKKSIQDYIGKKGVATGDSSKQFNYVIADVYASNGNNMRFVGISMDIYSMDKKYFSDIFRRAAVNGKTQFVMPGGNQPPHIGEYNENKVAINRQGFTVAMTKSGKILDSVDDILAPPTKTRDVKKILLDKAYNEACTRSYDPICYTEEQKKSHKIIYKISSGYIYLYIDKGKGADPELLWSYYIDKRSVGYFNPNIVIQ